MKSLLALLVVAVLSVCTVQAITIYVPQNYPTIGAAINAANDGDSIIVGPGIYDHAPIVYNEPNNITLLGNGFMGSQRTTVLGNFSTEVEGKFDIRYVKGWEIGGFELMIGHKGINTEGCNGLYIHDIYVHDVTWNYADGVMVNGNNYLIERCIFQGCPYAGLEIWYPAQGGHEFRNNTIVDCNNGVLVRGSTPSLVLKNNIITDCGDGVEFVGGWSGNEFLDYNDAYNNGDNWSGCTPGPHNISADPQFVGGVGAQQYMLQPTSPCIDAGDPNSPLDPDGTIADIGCFYFNQNVSPGQLTLDLEPVNPPIIIPVQGGSFNYTATLTCDSSNYALFDAWTELLLPNGYVMGPLFIRSNIFLGPGGSIFRNLSLYVSSWAMPGIYGFRGYLGDYPDSVYASDSFTFEKLAGNGGMYAPSQAYVTLSGWGEAETVYLPDGEVALPERLELGCTPNPFNPSTTLLFSLPAAGPVTLKIYDLSGRTVATLLDRPLEAGIHTAAFNAEDIASGIYLAVLDWGDQRANQRLMLLK